MNFEGQCTVLAISYDWSLELPENDAMQLVVKPILSVCNTFGGH